MIPSPWVALVLALGTFRVVRLIGWDDFPPIERLRDRLIGARLVRTSSANAGFTTETPTHAWIYQRPILAKFVGCAWCIGFWTSCVAYVAWLEEPKWTLYVLAPFALSSAVGLIARNLDA